MYLRDASQLEKAKLEDVLVELLYSRYKELVLRGGTAIWRCYGGNRFSRDLDFYMKAKSNAERMQHYRDIAEFLKEAGFAIKEGGYSREADAMHVMAESGSTKMKVDISFNYKKGTPTEYEKVDGSKIVVLALKPEELLNEKIEAYMDKLNSASLFKSPEANDLYDIWYLISIVKKPKAATVQALKGLANKIGNKQPQDMKSLDHVILAGLTPSFELMMRRIREWIDDNS